MVYSTKLKTLRMASYWRMYNSVVGSGTLEKSFKRTNNWNRGSL